MTVRNFVPHDQFAARPDEKRRVPSLPAVENAFATHCDELRSISLKIHAFAECAYKEYKSAQLLSKYMEDEGFVVERGVAGVETAFTATYTQGTGPVVSFNAEYDALPEIGHACGHNLIAICSAGAALATRAWLKEDPDRVGTVILFGTPAEENGGGKVDLLNAGLYKPVDISLMCHPTGAFDGCFFPIIAMSAFDVEFFGKSAHAAMSPWNGINALDAMIQVFNSINGMRQALRPRATVSGIISDGGKVPGLIPDHSQGAFSARARSDDDLKDLKAKLVGIVDSVALATGCKSTIKNKWYYKDLRTNIPLALRYQEYASLMGIKVPSRRDQMAVEAAAASDQGNVSYELPAMQFVYKIDVPEGVENHTPRFAEAAKSPQAHNQTILCSKLLAYVAVDYLVDGGFREEVKQSYSDGTP